MSSTSSVPNSRLVHVPVPVVVAGETLHILPFGYGQQVQVVAKLGAVLLSMGLKEGDTVSFDTLMEHGADAMLDITALAVGKSRAWIDTIPAVCFEEGMVLTETVFTVNATIFAKKVLPALRAKMSAMKGSPLLQSLLTRLSPVSSPAA